MNLPELLVGLTTHYNALIRSAASQLHLTASQAFHLISIPYDGIPMSKLAHKLGLDASTLTRNIQKLENLGLVKRNHDSYDKRVQKAVLTKQGIEIIEDSVHGLKSGLASGAHVIAKRGSVPDGDLSIAHRIVTHLDEITNDMLEELLQESL